MSNIADNAVFIIAKKCAGLVARYLAITAESENIKDTKYRIKETLQIFETEILTRWSPFCDHEAEKNFLSISYNGGKDCQVLLILYLASLYNTASFHSSINRLPAVYLKTYDNFSELTDFIASSSSEYQLELYETRNASMETSLMEYLLSLKLEHQEDTGILLGTRATDAKHYKMTKIQPTDKNYPKFIRIQPILNWKLSNVWSFLIFSDEQHCQLYDLGYTSLGKPEETVPNPWLVDEYNNKNLKNNLVFDYEFSQCKNLCNVRRGNGYLPGWFLLEDDKERDGRVHRLSKDS
ncbi:hypothetical protein QEN19_004135 [Hanseniaspora menglaensis]